MAKIRNQYNQVPHLTQDIILAIAGHILLHFDVMTKVTLHNALVCMFNVLENTRVGICISVQCIVIVDLYIFG